MLKLWCPAQLPLVSGCRNSGAPPHFSHSPLNRSGLYIYISLACETFAESSKQLYSAWGITEPFVLGDEMTKSGGLVRLLTSRSQHVSWARPGSLKVTKGTIVPFNPSSFSTIERPPLPLSAGMKIFIKKTLKKNLSLSAKIGFLQHFLNDKTSFWLFGGKRLIAKLIRGNFDTLWSYHFFSSNCSFEWKHGTIYLPTISVLHVVP